MTKIVTDWDGHGLVSLINSFVLEYLFCQLIGLLKSLVSIFH